MWPLIGAVAGTGLEMYGNEQKQQAMGQAQGQYSGALNQFYGQQQNDQLAENQQAIQLAQQRMGALGSMVGQYTAPTAGPSTYLAGENAAITKGSGMDAKLGDPTVTPNGGAAADLQSRLQQFYGSQIQRQAQAQADQLTWGGQHVQQGQAMAGFSLADQQLQNRLQALQRMSGMAAAQGQVQLGQINQAGQQSMFGAQSAGNGWLQAGALLGASGTLANMGRGTQPAPQEPNNGSFIYGTTTNNPSLDTPGATDLASQGSVS